MGADDEIVVRFRAEVASLNRGIDEVKKAIADLGGEANGSFRKAREGADSFAKVISTGKQANNLKQIASQLGGLAGASGVARGQMDALLDTIESAAVGAGSLAGPVGIAVAAIAALSTGLAYLALKNREAAESAKKLQEETLSLANRFRALEESGARIPDFLRDFSSGMKDVADEEHARRLHRTTERLKEVGEQLRRGKGDTFALNQEQATLLRDLAALNAGFLSFADAIERTSGAEERRRAKLDQAGREDQERARLGFESIARMITEQDALAAANEAAAARAQAAWLAATQAIQGALADMVLKGKLDLKELEREIKRIAAQAAVKTIFSLIGSGLFPGGPALTIGQRFIQSLGLSVATGNATAGARTGDRA